MRNSPSEWSFKFSSSVTFVVNISRQCFSSIFCTSAQSSPAYRAPRSMIAKLREALETNVSRGAFVFVALGGCTRRVSNYVNGFIKGVLKGEGGRDFRRIVAWRIFSGSVLIRPKSATRAPQEALQTRVRGTPASLLSLEAARSSPNPFRASIFDPLWVDFRWI